MHDLGIPKCIRSQVMDEAVNTILDVSFRQVKSLKDYLDANKLSLFPLFI